MLVVREIEYRSARDEFGLEEFGGGRDGFGDVAYAGEGCEKVGDASAERSEAPNSQTEV